MSQTITCPKCRKSLKIGDKLVGKTIACPGCKTKFPVSDSKPAPAPDILAFKDEDPPPAVVEEKKKQTVFDEPVPVLKPDAEPYLQVIDDADEIRSLSLEKVRDCLINRTLTRANYCRRVEPKPSPDDYDDGDRDEDFRKELKAWKARANWLPIGKSLADDEPSIKQLYEPFKSPAEPITKVAFGVLLILFGLMGWPWVNSLEMEKPIEEFGQGEMVTPEATRGLKVRHRTQFFLLEWAVRGGAAFNPEGSEKMLKLTIFIVYLLIAAAVAGILALLVGVGIHIFHPKLYPEQYEKAPPDGYME